MGVSLPTPPLADNTTAAKGTALLSLASAILSSKAVPTNSVRDALHIAIAATQGIDYLITWNFKHIKNTSTRNMIVNVVSDSGLICPVLCSPEELMGEDDAK